MTESRKSKCASRLGKLPTPQQQAIFAHCETVTLEEGVRWLETNFEIQISENRLSAWLRRKREQKSILAPIRKIRPDSPLSLLTPEQQEDIFSNCEGLTLEEGLRWLKAEHQIESSSYGLSRWLTKHRNDKITEARLEAIREDRDRAMLLGNVFGAATAIAEANSVLFAQAIFEEFRKQPGERDEKRLAQFMSLALKARAVELAGSRFHFDAAKKAMDHAADLQKISQAWGAACETIKLSPDEKPENMRMEIRITVARKVGRIVVLAANPRTARGFSGDLILDEFAFHEDSAAIWDAVEPIVSSNPGYLCRIASTGNGRFNMFYKMANESSPYTVSRVRRSEAWRMGVKIYDPATRRELTPDEARAAALDKGSYDQNYECAFNDENMALLTHDLISACEYPTDFAPGDCRPRECHICSQDWTGDALEFLRACKGPLGIGLDVGRNRDITVVAIGEKLSGIVLTRAILRISAMRLPQQLDRLKPLLDMPNFGRLSGDATGLGLGLVEFAQELCGAGRAEAVQFASRERRTVQGIEQGDSALITELMALDLLQLFDAGAIRIPCEMALRESLRKPERITTGSGVRIAATRDGTGHADEFWSMALMVRSLKSAGTRFAYDIPDSISTDKYAGMDRRVLAW